METNRETIIRLKVSESEIKESIQQWAEKQTEEKLSSLEVKYHLGEHKHGTIQGAFITAKIDATAE